MKPVGIEPTTMQVKSLTLYQLSYNLRYKRQYRITFSGVKSGTRRCFISDTRKKGLQKTEPWNVLLSKNSDNSGIRTHALNGPAPEAGALDHSATLSLLLTLPRQVIKMAWRVPRASELVFYQSIHTNNPLSKSQITQSIQFN